MIEMLDQETRRLFQQATKKRLPLTNNDIQLDVIARLGKDLETYFQQEVAPFTPNKPNQKQPNKILNSLHNIKKTLDLYSTHQTSPLKLTTEYAINVSYNRLLNAAATFPQPSVIIGCYDASLGLILAAKELERAESAFTGDRQPSQDVINLARSTQPSYDSDQAGKDYSDLLEETDELGLMLLRDPSGLTNLDHYVKKITTTPEQGLPKTLSGLLDFHNKTAVGIGVNHFRRTYLAVYPMSTNLILPVIKNSDIPQSRARVEAAEKQALKALEEMGYNHSNDLAVTYPS